MRFSIAGLQRVDQTSERAIGAIAGRQILGKIVGADREERRVKLLDRQAGGRHLDHDADIRKRRGNAFSPQLIDRFGKQPARRFQFAGHRDHGKHDFEILLHGRARQSPQLNMKTSGRARQSRRPRTPRNGLASPSTVNPGTGLSPPASNVRIVTGRLPAQRRTAS